MRQNVRVARVMFQTGSRCWVMHAVLGGREIATGHALVGDMSFECDSGTNSLYE